MNLEKAKEIFIPILKETRKNREPLYFTSINNRILSQIYGWRCSSILDAELLASFRNADISVTRSTLLKCLSACLGSPLSKQITTIELLFAICQAMGKLQKGLFLIGDNEASTKRAGIKLQESSQGLRLVGLTAPPIYIEGENLVFALKRDALLVEQINSSNAALLVVSLSSPKQEIWFERIRRHLKVLLVFGVGNALNEIGATKSFLRSSIASLGRGLQSLRSGLKIGCLCLPLIVYHNINRGVAKWQSAKYMPRPCQKAINYFCLSANLSICAVPCLLCWMLPM